jgi:MoxR-like ATPase
VNATATPAAPASSKDPASNESPWEDPSVDASFDLAAASFGRFFSELRGAFLEREAILTQLELALLCREHCLIIGPPGTAKSAVAASVLGRIVDEKTHRPSLFSKQLVESTVQTDLIGPVDFKVLTETGRTEYLTEEGMLGSVHAFLDEVFDGRDMLLRSILNVLNERELKHGRKVTVGRCECAVMTSNRYLSEVLQRSPETLQAFADRISFISFAPRSFARKQSRAQMLQRANVSQWPTLGERLTLQQLSVLQTAVARVEVPAAVSEGLEVLADALERELLTHVTRLPDYVPTKYFSQRTMVKALWALKASVVRERIYRRPDRRLVAEQADLALLHSFFLLGGPQGQELDALLKATVDPRERAQLEIIRLEQKAFADALNKVMPLLKQAADREADELVARDDLASAEAMTRTWSPAVASTLAKTLRGKLTPGPRHPANRAALVRAAEHLLLGLDLRASRGLLAHSEARSGIALLVSFADVLDLVRQVPELNARLGAVAANVRSFCQQAAELTVLAAEGAEFEDNLRLEGLAGLALNVAEELSRLAEVQHAAAMVQSHDDRDQRVSLQKARERVAAALRRRAQRAFGIVSAGKKIDALEGLAADSKRLKELEAALVELSPKQRGLREELLTPLGESYARQALNGQPFTRIEGVVRAVEAVIDTLHREGASPEACVLPVRDVIEHHVRELARNHALPHKLTPEAKEALTGEAYQGYRALSALAPDGEVLAFRTLSAALTKIGVAPPSAPARDAVVTAELNWLFARAKYLKTWLGLVMEQLPDPQTLRSRTEAERAFELLLKSRFPTLVTREGELLKVRAGAQRLIDESGERGETARQISATVAQIESGFQTFSRQVLDARTGR